MSMYVFVSLSVCVSVCPYLLCVSLLMHIMPEYRYCQDTSDVMGYFLIIVMAVHMMYIVSFLNFEIVWRSYSTTMMWKSATP